eukprot:13292748-Alexandrium_andersonii.AAC.1
MRLLRQDRSGACLWSGPLAGGYGGWPYLGISAGLRAIGVVDARRRWGSSEYRLTAAATWGKAVDK